jgi:transketolase
MAAIMNGVSLHSGFIPYGGTFLMFSEYARNALRMAALMKVQSIFVFTHDSVGLGEDGPTHQPVEQTSTLRLMPNMSVWRPADTVESAVAWKAAIERKTGPSSLILSRQDLPFQERSKEQIDAISKGAYVMLDAGGTPDAIIIATGSELAIAMDAARQLNDKGKKVRVVSMPSVDVFEAQDEAYQESVLPAAVRARVAIEAGVTDYWRKFVGLDGKVVGIDRFGESAPIAKLYEYFGITADAVVKAVEEVL